MECLPRPLPAKDELTHCWEKTQEEDLLKLAGGLKLGMSRGSHSSWRDAPCWSEV